MYVFGETRYASWKRSNDLYAILFIKRFCFRVLAVPYRSLKPAKSIFANIVMHHCIIMHQSLMIGMTSITCWLLTHYYVTIVHTLCWEFVDSFCRTDVFSTRYCPWYYNSSVQYYWQNLCHVSLLCCDRSGHSNVMIKPDWISNCCTAVRNT